MQKPYSCVVNKMFLLSQGHFAIYEMAHCIRKASLKNVKKKSAKQSASKVQAIRKQHSGTVLAVIFFYYYLFIFRAILS